MKTTVEMAEERYPMPEAAARFQAAGRILARAEILRDGRSGDAGEGETGDASLLTRLAAVVALHGIEYGRGWIEGAHYTEGIRMHVPWMIGAQILWRAAGR